MQGLSYIAAYLVIFIPVIVTMFDMPNGYYVFFACIFPTQGFLNSIVYFRPKYVSVRNRQGNTRPSRLRATLEVLDIHLSLPRPFASATSHVKSTGHSNDLNGDWWQNVILYPTKRWSMCVSCLPDSKHRLRIDGRQSAWVWNVNIYSGSMGMVSFLRGLWFLVQSIASIVLVGVALGMQPSKGIVHSKLPTNVAPQSSILYWKLL